METSLETIHHLVVEAYEHLMECLELNRSAATTCPPPILLAQSLNDAVRSHGVRRAATVARVPLPYG